MTSTESEEPNPAAFASWLRFWRYVIAALEVVGGLTGLYLVTFGTLIGTSRLILLLFFVLFAASVWGGVLLAMGKRGGVAVSLAVQAVQLCQIAAGGLVYTFVSGLQVVVGLRQTDAGPDVGSNITGPARFLVFLNPPDGVIPAGLFTGLNVAALLSIICLLYVRAAERLSLTRSAAETAVTPTKPEGVWPPEPKP